MFYGVHYASHTEPRDLLMIDNTANNMLMEINILTAEHK